MADIIQFSDAKKVKQARAEFETACKRLDSSLGDHISVFAALGPEYQGLIRDKIKRDGSLTETTDSE